MHNRIYALSTTLSYAYNYIANIMEEFTSAHVASSPDVYRPYNEYTKDFNTQAQAIYCSLMYILPLELIHRIFNFMNPWRKTTNNIIQRHKESKIIHKRIEGNTVIIDCPQDANYYLGKMYLWPASYDDIISIKLTIGTQPVYETDGNGLYLRDYLYENSLDLTNAIPLNILCNSSHQQPFPLYKITGSEGEIKIHIESSSKVQMFIGYELLDLEKTQERARAPMLQAFLNKMKPNTLDIIYEQMQIRCDIFPPTDLQSIDLAFKQSIKTLMWTGSGTISTLAMSQVPGVRGLTRFTNSSSVMSNKIIPYKYYGKFMPENVHLYSFVSNPTDYRHQFGLNGSRIDYLHLVRATVDDKPVDCYAINFNILMFGNGNCILKYIL